MTLLWESSSQVLFMCHVCIIRLQSNFFFPMELIDSFFPTLPLQGQVGPSGLSVCA